MENASKALIIAGSVLLSILIIGSLVFMFNTLSNLKSTEASSADAQKLAEYNSQIETFNRKGIYGSEVLSLANLIDDYNKRQADLKGYVAIKLEVITKQIYGDNVTMQTSYIQDNGYKLLIEDFNKLENIVNQAKNVKRYGKTIEQYYNMRENEKVEHLTKQGKVKALEEINKLVEEYSNKKSELTEFKNKKFKQPNVEYDSLNGRVISMYFEEVTL